MKARATFLRTEQIAPTVHVAGCFQREPGMTFRYRVPSHHLILIESGRMRAKPPGKEFEARAGDLVCFRSANANEYEWLEPALFYQAQLQFAPPPHHQQTPLLGELGPLPVLVSLGDWFAPARRVFETLSTEISFAGALHQLRIVAAVWELLTIVTGVLASRSPGQPSLNDWDRLRLRLGANLSQDLKIAQIAREMNLHPSYFIRQFKQRFGLSPKAYLTQARLREAVRLLRSTDQPVKSIAFDLGFPSVQAFERLLKRHAGLPPSEARSSRLFAPSDSPSSLNPFQMERFNVPPGAPPNWFDEYQPREERPKRRR